MQCKIFFCLACSKGFALEEEALKCDCNPQFIVQGIFTALVPIKRTRWGHFLHWVLSHDIGYGLAFMGGVIINSILLSHLNLSFKETLVESICIGFILIRLFKDES